jgi:hypothetical protein
MTLPKMEISHVTGASHHICCFVYHFILSFSHAFQPSAGRSDPYYGHTASLFTCPEVPSPPAPPSTTQTPQLEHFIAYALHHMQLHTSVTFTALYLLQCLKACFPAAKELSGHWLFTSAFMFTSNIICDDAYSNMSWCIVGQGMFTFREISQMEWEMCSYLEWQLSIDPSMLHDFQACVQQDFASPSPYCI